MVDETPASGPEGGGFHWQDGLFFTRLRDGSVRIRKFTGPPYVDPTLEVVIPPNEWASIVASMSATGETYETWRMAYNAQLPPEHPGVAG